VTVHFGGGETRVAEMISVPVFIVMVGITVLIAGGLESIGLASLRPLLLLQFLLLAGCLVICVAAGPYIEPNATNAILAGMLGVSAMAVQNALVQISPKGAPSTAVMTSNVTRLGGARLGKSDLHLGPACAARTGAHPHRSGAGWRAPGGWHDGHRADRSSTQAVSPLVQGGGWRFGWAGTAADLSRNLGDDD
jgi:hypothetical protein